MELKKRNELVNKIKKKQAHKYREQTSGYHWEGGKGTMKGERKREKRVIMRLYEIMCVNILKIVKHHRI